MGNFRSPSREPAVNGPEDYSDTRGREPVAAGDPDVVREPFLRCRSLDPFLTVFFFFCNQIISTGRGGRGNIRSPSRDPVLGDTASLGVSPARSLSRGRAYDRTYDRETIASIDIANDTGVVREISNSNAVCSPKVN